VARVAISFAIADPPSQSLLKHWDVTPRPAAVRPLESDVPMLAALDDAFGASPVEMIRPGASGKIGGLCNIKMFEKSWGVLRPLTDGAYG
jgi:hypothetical protein